MSGNANSNVHKLKMFFFSPTAFLRLILPLWVARDYLLYAGRLLAFPTIKRAVRLKIHTVTQLRVILLVILVSCCFLSCTGYCQLIGQVLYCR